MAITKQTARKKHPDPRPDKVATQPAPRNASKRVPRKLSKLWSGTLTERHPHQDVNLADLLYFKKGCDYVNVSSLPDEQGCRYCYIVYFDNDLVHGHRIQLLRTKRQILPVHVYVLPPGS